MVDETNNNKKQSIRLIKEGLGVPKPIEFWVDTLSSLLNDGLMMLLSSDDKEVFLRVRSTKKVLL